MNLDRLLDLWEKLGERERTITLTFLSRLYAGQRKYGKITNSKKDWSYEAIEEALDASVYLSCLLQDKSDKALQNSMPEAVSFEPPPPLPDGFIEHLASQALPVHDGSPEATRLRIEARRARNIDLSTESEIYGGTPKKP